MKKVTRRRRRATSPPPSNFHEDVEAELLPLHNIKSVVRMVLPKKVNGKTIRVTASFYRLLSRCVAEFIHVTVAQLHLSIRNKSIINEEDILGAMEALGISQYSLPLRVFMNDYRVLTYKVITKRLGLQTGQEGLLALTDAADPPEARVAGTNTS